MKYFLTNTLQKNVNEIPHLLYVWYNNDNTA